MQGWAIYATILLSRGLITQPCIRLSQNNSIFYRGTLCYGQEIALVFVNGSFLLRSHCFYCGFYVFLKSGEMKSLYFVAMVIIAWLFILSIKLLMVQLTSKKMSKDLL